MANCDIKNENDGKILYNFLSRLYNKFEFGKGLVSFYS